MRTLEEIYYANYQPSAKYFDLRLLAPVRAQTHSPVCEIQLAGISHCGDHFNFVRSGAGTFCVLLCVFAGRGTYDTPVGSWTPEAGDVMIIHPGSRSHYVSSRESPWTLGWFNVCGNLFKAGPGTKNLDGEYLQVYTSASTSMIPGSFYIKDNVYDVSAVEKSGNYLGKYPDYEDIEAQEKEYVRISSDKPFGFSHPAACGPIEKEYDTIFREAGASIVRDAVDKRIIREVRTGKPEYKGSVTGIPGIIDSENDVL